VPTSEQAREYGRRGGIASAKAKKKRADLKKAMGVDATNEMLLAFATFQQAVKGNQRAVENVIKLSTVDKDKHDIAEQKERIKALKLKNKQAEELGGASDEEIIIIADIPRE